MRGAVRRESRGVVAAGRTHSFAYCCVHCLAVRTNSSCSAMYCRATTASCGSFGSGEASRDWTESRAVFSVRAGLHWSFNTSRQMAPLAELTFGCLEGRGVSAPEEAHSRHLGVAPNFRLEAHLGRLERVLGWQADVDEESAALVGRRVWAWREGAQRRRREAPQPSRKRQPLLHHTADSTPGGAVEEEETRRV